jgi:hypothetical protein
LAVPFDTPLRAPLEGDAKLATPVLSLLHVPPNGEALNVVPAPEQNVVLPEIADAAAFTDTICVVAQLPIE